MAARFFLSVPYLFPPPLEGGGQGEGEIGDTPRTLKPLDATA